MPKKILVVDDEPNVLRLLTARLSINNYEVITASDGVSAVEKAREGKPDLILMDIRMPAGDGLMVFEYLNKIKPITPIPIIFMTANPSEDIRAQVREMGAKDFIAKPFDADELLIKIKKALCEDID